MKTLIIIPTYNELENLPRLLPVVLSKDSTINILIVDDNSPDGTASFVEGEMKKDNRIHIIKRPSKQGLGTAYIAGFKFALQNQFDLIFEMDADFSHDPNEIPKFLEEIKKSDVVLGSRYITGVNVINWPMRRLLLSWFANFYTRVITGMSVHDATGGFKCFRKEVLQAIDLDKVTSNGYAFQIEMTFKAWKKGFRIKEIPIIFMDRVKGKSKMSKKIVREAVTMVWKLRLKSIFGMLK
ncbi:MAG: polyprenol monophosphomannose synthase [Ignavibacteriota bacterium]|jgi:dolichol-phosphate mannosyltransferase|nr:polyprenol monophosphomannose synthase [Ignavibacteriales bacterium]MBL1123664.1 polyprenol monophosphomannose synthase [Ignavibacteriota bacterium]MBV6421895.1 Undecaprenyl-phosphate mannosyltransferase [Ignavibacteriaceae bacterium]MCE7855479.1 polyprenol monophosphomannose synthase [Ignavibacteria bacterium CHB3]MEB2294913.1 polyprenol monophosphomannose synthase [Ignavibacteria bacterium]